MTSNYTKSRNVLTALIQGFDPVTSEELPTSCVVNKIEVNRAMHTAVGALEQMNARSLRRAQLPEGVGKTWTEQEEAQLREEFQRGDTVADIAKVHKRTLRAIEARLELLGILSPEQRTTNNSFAGAPGTGKRRRKAAGGEAENKSD